MIYPALAAVIGCAAAGLFWANPAWMERPWRLGAAWITLLVLPFAALGPASLVAGTDELLLALPSYLLANAGKGYAQSLIGGVELNLASTNGVSSLVSLERLLFAHLPPWLVILAGRASGLAIAFAGGALLARAASGDRRVMAACGLWGTLLPFNDLVIGWAFAGMSLAAYVAAARIEARRYWLPVIGLAVLWPFSHSPLQLLAGIALSWLVVIVLLGHRLHLSRLIGAIALVFGAIVLNWSELIWGLMTLGATFGRHFEKTWSSAITNYYWAIGKLHYSYAFLFIAATILIAISWRRHLKVMPIILVFIAIGPLLQRMDYSLIGLGILNGFNFNYAVFSLLPILVVVLAKLGGEIAARPSRQARLGLALIGGAAVGAVSADWVPDAVSMIGTGGQRAALQVLDTKIPGYAPQSFRAITVPVGLAPTMTAAAGIDTLDGYNISTPARLRAYWELGVKGKADASAAFHGYVALDKFRTYDGPGEVLDLPGVADFDFLRMANVKYVVSRLPLNGPGLLRVAGVPEGDSWAALPKVDRVKRRLASLFSPSPVLVYQLDDPWPRLFLAATVARSGYRFDQPEFYGDIRAFVGSGGVVQDVESPPVENCCGTGRLTKVEITPDGAEASVDVSSQPVVLVLNVTWTPFQTAWIDGRPAPTFPVNGFQTAVVVPTGSHDVSFQYRRAGLRDHFRSVFPGDQPSGRLPGSQ